MTSRATNTANDTHKIEKSVRSRQANTLNDIRQKRETYRKYTAELSELYDELLDIQDRDGTVAYSSEWTQHANQIKQKIAQLRGSLVRLDAIIEQKKLLDSISK